jgi:hypothetical protein
MPASLFAFAVLGVAFAEEPAASGPVTPSPPVTQPAPAPPPVERPLAVPAGPPAPVTAARLQALRGYKAGRLQLRDETEFRGGSAWVMGGGYGGMWGPGYGAWGWGGPVVIDPPTALRTWGVYRGPERLDVPEFLTAVGQTQRRKELDADITRLKRRATFWSVIAGLGGAGLATGLVGMSTVETRQQYDTFNAVTLGGTLVMATGFIGNSFPRGKESALRRYPSATMGSDEAQQLIDAHNEALREELGLSAADVWALEAE